MTIKPVVKMGNEQLATPSLPVTQFGTEELFEIIKDMEDTMTEKNGVGIAAPQIGALSQILFLLKRISSMIFLGHDYAANA